MGGLSMDCTITPIRLGGLSVIQTTDTLYPLIPDPFLFGRIACASLLSAVYATGVTSVDNILCHLSISTRLSEVERDKVVPLILEGFREAATEAGSSVSGGISITVRAERSSIEDLVLMRTKLLKWSSFS